MDSITLLSDTLFLKNDTLYAKLGELTMNHKYIAENNGCCWTNVVIWFIICAVIIWLAYIVKDFLTNRKDDEEQKDELKKAKQKLSEIDSKQEEINATYRSKVLDFMEKEVSSCQRIHADLKTLLDENKKLTKQINQFLVNAEKSPFVTQADIDTLKKDLAELEKTLENIDLASIKASVDGLSTEMKNEQNYFASNAYLKVLSGFMNKKCDIPELLK